MAAVAALEHGFAAAEPASVLAVLELGLADCNRFATADIRRPSVRRRLARLRM